MAKKKKVEDFEVDVKTKKVKVSAKKEGKKLDVVVDTPKVDVELHKDENKKEFIYDGEKLDVTVTEENGEIKADVKAENKFLRAVGNALVRRFTRNFKKQPREKKSNGYVSWRKRNGK